LHLLESSDGAGVFAPEHCAALLPFPTHLVDIGLLVFEVWRKPPLGIRSWACVGCVPVHDFRCGVYEFLDRAVEGWSSFDFFPWPNLLLYFMANFCPIRTGVGLSFTN
jgi:hypothetical protein